MGWAERRHHRNDDVWRLRSIRRCLQAFRLHGRPRGGAGAGPARGRLIQLRTGGVRSPPTVTSMAKPQIIVLDDRESLFVRAAEEIVHVSGESICTHGQFSWCLTGGSTPADVYSLIATRFHLSVDWNAVHLFWGDERCVPPDDEASNYGMA